jgi:hypothetical protein
VVEERCAGALQAALDRATRAERDLATTRAALDETRAELELHEGPAAAVDLVAVADTARVDDYLGTEWLTRPRPGGTCSEHLPGNFAARCSRPVHDRGQHLATSGAVVVAVWPHAGDAARDREVVDRGERYGDEIDRPAPRPARRVGSFAAPSSPTLRHFTDPEDPS